MRTNICLILALSFGCEPTEPSSAGEPTPNNVEGYEPLEIEGQPWIYTGTIPGESEAGVTCTEDECERCVLLQDGQVSITFRPIGSTAQDWTTMDYGTYSAAPASSTGYVVDLRWNWSAVSADGLANANDGYIVISEASSAASDYRTLGIGLCPEWATPAAPRPSISGATRRR